MGAPCDQAVHLDITFTRDIQIISNKVELRGLKKE